MACAILGTYYERGAAGRRGPSQAVRWYSAGTLAGNALAGLLLAKMLCDGTGGLTRDRRAAFKCIRALAEADFSTSFSELARCYAEGLGTRRNDRLAIGWLRRAATGGSRTAMRDLAVALRDGTGVRRDLRKARAWFRRAAAAGDRDARRELARLRTAR